MARRWLSLSLLTLCAGVWCVAIGVLGLWLMGHDHVHGLLSRPLISFSAGLACVCAAQLVFLDSVADQLFPRAHRGVRIWLRGANALTLSGSVGVLLLALLAISV